MVSFCLPIAIYGDKHSIRKRKTFRILSSQDISWHRACKNVMRKNGFSRYCHFLHNNLLPTTNPCRSTNDMVTVNDFSKLCSIRKKSWLLSIISKNRGGYYSFENDNLHNLTYYIGHWAVFDHMIVYNEAISYNIRGYILFEFKF